LLSDLSRDRYLGFVYGTFAGVCFGTAAIFIRLLDLNALSIVSWRLLIGGSVLMILIISLGKFDKKFLRNGLLLGTILFMHFYFFVKSVQDTFIINSTVIVNSAPIISLVIIAIFKQEDLFKLDVVVVSLGFLGILIMFYGNLNFRINLIGDLEAFMAALMISIYSIIARKLLRIEMISIELASFIYLIAGLEALLLSSLIGRLQIPLNIDQLMIILMLGLIPTAIGHTLYLASLNGLAPHETQVLALLEPIVATFLGIILFNEKPLLISIIGSSLIYTSILLLLFKRR